MKGRSCILIIGACLFYLACSDKPKLYNMDGVWNLKRIYSGYQYFVEIEGDTFSFINCSTHSKLSSYLDMTEDSLTIPNPCLKERYSYNLKKDTLYLDSTFLLFRTENISSKEVLCHSDLVINLEEFEIGSMKEKLSKIDLSLYIGKQSKRMEKDSLNYFSNGYSLKGDEIIKDSVSFKRHVILAQKRSIGKPVVVIYKDKNFPSESYNFFKKNLVSKFQHELYLFEAYFNANSKYHLGFKRLNSDS